ncbi:Uv radiation resistance-associated protein, partial [Thalictrum thalictroides]
MDSESRNNHQHQQQQIEIIDSSFSDSLKVIDWEDFQQELARFSSLSSTLSKAKTNKLALQQNLQSFIHLSSDTLNRSNQLQQFTHKLDHKRLLIGNLSLRAKTQREDARLRNHRLNLQIKSLLLAGNALSTANDQLQEANRLLAGERGHVRLQTLQKMLRVRLQYMVSQISTLYPVKASLGSRHEEKSDLSAIVNRSGNSMGPKPLSPGSLTISGLQLTTHPLKKMSFFSDKKDIQRSATALGYIAHVVLLIGSYLDVPLRYPLRMGGSHSYINDYASSVECASSDTYSNPILVPNLKTTEFPLFLEGQDTTRAAYAIFLLNK